MTEPFSLLLPVYSGDKPDYFVRAFRSSVDQQTLRPDQVVVVVGAGAGSPTAERGAVGRLGGHLDRRDPLGADDAVLAVGVLQDDAGAVVRGDVPFEPGALDQQPDREPALRGPVERHAHGVQHR